MDYLESINNAREKQTFASLAIIDVMPFVDKKNGLDYLSWMAARSLAEMIDSNVEFNDSRAYQNGSGMSVECEVKMFGKIKKASLAITDFKNKAVAMENIDSAMIENTAQRALVKALANHGLGSVLYMKESFRKSYVNQQLLLDSLPIVTKNIKKEEA